MGDILGAFEYGIPAAIIIAIYLVIVKIIDAKKDKRQAIINSTLIDSFAKLNNFLEYFTKDIIEKEKDKCEATIKSSFNSFSSSLITFCIETIINNNVIENKEIIIENIKKTVSTGYWNIFTNLMLYKSNECKVSEYLEPKWKDEISDSIISIIFSNKTKEQRIHYIINKLNIVIDSYCIHIVNRYTKNAK